jgi:hypothetical protein
MFCVDKRPWCQTALAPKQLRSQMPPDTVNKAEFAQDVHKGVGFGIEILFQLSPPPMPLAIGWMMPQGGFGFLTMVEWVGRKQSVHWAVWGTFECALGLHPTCALHLQLGPFPSAQVGRKTQHLRPIHTLCFLHWNHSHLCSRAFNRQLLLTSDLPTFILPWLPYHCPQPFAVSIANCCCLWHCQQLLTTDHYPPPCFPPPSWCASVRPIFDL